MKTTSKSTKITLRTLASVFIGLLLVISSIGIYFNVKNRTENPVVIENPVDFSIDTWDGETITSMDWKSGEQFANRGDKAFTINSAEAFAYFIDRVNNHADEYNYFEGYTVYLNSSIDLAGHKINSIGTETSPFKGTFDGGYYTIYNATLTGNGLFAHTDNATIKNIGLYNATIKSNEEFVGGLIGNAVNTNIENSFIRLNSITGTQNVAGLVGTYISNNGKHHIKQSFVDSTLEGENVYGLVGKILTNASSQNAVVLEDNYYTQGDIAVGLIDTLNFVNQETTFKATNINDFANLDYGKYEDGYIWNDYTFIENSRELDFNFPILYQFNKVYMTGSGYENVIIDEKTGEIKNVETIAESFEILDTNSKAEVNIIVEKVFMDTTAVATGTSEITLNASVDTTIIRGNNEENLIVSAENSTLILGNEVVNANTPEIVIDGNRDKVESLGLDSGAAVYACGYDITIYDNVTIKDNINNTTSYGGGICLDSPTLNEESIDILGGTVTNCEAEYGGGVCVINGSYNFGEEHSVSNCTAIYGGGLAIVGEDGEVESTMTPLRSKYMDKERHAQYLASGVDVTASTTISSTYSGNSATYGGGVHVGTAVTVTLATGAAIYSNTATNSGGGIMLRYNVNATLNMNDGAIYNNTADSNGGGVFIDVSCVFNMYGGSIGVTTGNTNDSSYSNYAKYGGGIGTYAGTITIYNGEISKNRATEHGGGIYTASGAILNLHGAKVNNNKATFGGGLAMNGGSDIVTVGGELEYTTSSDSLVNYGSYGFTRETEYAGSWIYSTNNGVSSSYSLAKIKFEHESSGGDVVIKCINYAESNYDFGIVSTLDPAINLGDSSVTGNWCNADAPTSYVQQSFKGKSQAGVQYVTFKNVSEGDHYFYVKYRKDGSVNSNDDCFKFAFIKPEIKSNTAVYGGGISKGSGNSTLHLGTYISGNTATGEPEANFYNNSAETYHCGYLTRDFFDDDGETLLYTRYKYPGKRASLSSLPTPTKPGYTFKGWTSVNGMDSQKHTVDDYTYRGTITTNTSYQYIDFFAMWEALPTPAYLNTNWRNIIIGTKGPSNAILGLGAASVAASVSNIMSIQFIEGTTLPDGFNSNYYWKVGASDATSTTATDSVRAYWKLTTVSSTKYYELAFVNTTGGTIVAPENCSSMFSGLTNLQTLTFDNFNTSYVTNMSNMFYNCSKLTSLDLTCFDTGNVTDMSNMFWNGIALTSLDVTSFNTSNVTTMRYMFYCCKLLTTLDLSSFNAQKVTDMYYMFSSCDAITSLDLSSFNSSAVTDCGMMFYSCDALRYLDMSSFDMSLVTNVSSMLKYCNSLVYLKAPNNIQDSYSIDMPTNTAVTGSYYSDAEPGVVVTSLKGKHSGSIVAVARTITFDANGGTCATTSMSVKPGESITLPTATYPTGEEFMGWYTAVRGGTQISDDNIFDDPSITTLYARYNLPVYLKNTFMSTLGIGNKRFVSIKFVNGTVLPEGFSETNCYNVGTSSATSTDIIDTVKAYWKSAYKTVTINGNSYSGTMYSWVIMAEDGKEIYLQEDASYLFQGGADREGGYYNFISELVFDNINTSKVKNMSYMFDSLYSLTSLDLSKFDTSDVTDMTSMFASCQSLKNVNLSSFDTSKVTNMFGLFQACNNLLSVNLTNFNTSNVTNMQSMFNMCSALKSLDLSNFDTRKVTTMNSMFQGCLTLKALDLSNFVTPALTDVRYMFAVSSGSSATNNMSLETIDISNMDLTNATSRTGYEFRGCHVLKMVKLPKNVTAYLSFSSSALGNSYYYYLDSDPTTRKTSVKTSASGDTLRAGATVTFNVNGTTGTISSKTVRYGLEYGELPTPTYDYDFLGWYTAGGVKVTADTIVTEGANHTLYAYWDMPAFLNSTWKTLIVGKSTDSNGNTLSTTIADIYKVRSIIFVEGTELPEGFEASKHFNVGTTSATSTDVLNTVKVYYRSDSASSSYFHLAFMNPTGREIYAPQDSSKLFELTVTTNNSVTVNTYVRSMVLTNLYTDYTTNMYRMFYLMTNLTTIEIPNFNTSNVTNMSYMFSYSESLTSLDVSHFDTSNVTNMSYMFDRCSSLTSLDLSNFDTSKVTDMLRIFAGCSSLTSLDVSNFDTSNITNMARMFDSCSSLTSLDLSSFDTSNVTSMMGMFDTCSSLTTLDVSSFDTSNVTEMTWMFEDCSSLTSLDVSNFDTSKVTNMNWIFQNCSSLTYLNISSFDLTAAKTQVSSVFNGCNALITIETPKVVTSTAITLPTTYSYYADKAPSTKVTKIAAAQSDTIVRACCYVSLNANGGSVSPSTILVKCSLPYGELPIPTRTNYEFLGWFTSTTGGTEVTSETIVTATTTHYVYAQWKGIAYLNKNWKSLVLGKATDSTGATVATPVTEANLLGIMNAAGMNVGSSLTSGLPYFIIGAPDENSTTVTDNLRAYWKADEGLLMFVPTNQSTGNVVITYFPADSSSLFEGLSNMTICGGNLNTSKVTNMSRMFYNCKKLVNISFIEEETRTITSNVTDMSDMFCNCSALTSLDLSNFDTSKVTDMSDMFRYCSALTTLNVSTWNTSNVTNMSSMFSFCESLTSVDVSNWNTGSLVDIGSMFNNCTSLTSINVSNWDTRYIQIMSGAFSSCLALTSLDVSNWNTTNVTNMALMFSNCKLLTSVDVSNWNTSNVIKMGNMFEFCRALTSLDVSHFNTSSVTDISYMFYQCDSLTSLDVTNWDTSNVYNMSGLFYSCAGLTSLDVTNFNTSNVTNMENMFRNCWALESLDLSNWNTSKVSNITCMFYYCKILTTLDLSNWDIDQLTSRPTNMFAGCTKLLTINVPATMNLAIDLPTGGYTYYADNAPDTVITQITSADQEVVRAGWAITYVDRTDTEMSYVGTALDDKAYKLYRYGANDTLPTDLVAGYRIEYYTSNTATTPITSISATATGAQTIYVKFVATNITLTLDAGQGSFGADGDSLANHNKKTMTLQVGQPFGEIPTPTRVGAIFKGWIMESDSSVKIDEDSMVLAIYEGIVLLAQWENKAAYLNSGWKDLVMNKTTDDGGKTLPTAITASNIIGIEFITGYFNIDISTKDTIQLYAYNENYDTLTLTNYYWFKVGQSSISSSTVTTDGVIAFCVADANNKYTIYIGSPNWQTIYAPQDSKRLFYNLTAVTSIKFDNFNTSNVTSMKSMFSSCDKLTSISVNNFNTSRVEDMSSMFSGCSALTSLNLSRWNTSNVTDMSNMFSSCGDLTSLDLSNFNTSNVEYMSYMFSMCTGLDSIDLSYFNTSNLKYAEFMFSNCQSLTTLDISNFDLDQTINMKAMFQYCNDLKTLDLSNFNTSNVTDMSYMFQGCSSLTSLDLSNFDMDQVTNVTDMLSGCTKLLTINVPSTMNLAIDLPTGGYTYYADNAVTTAITQITSASQENVRAGWAVNYMDYDGSAFSGDAIADSYKVYRYGVALTLPTPTKAGFTFDGWYTSANGSTKATTVSATDTSAKTFYGKWSANDYTVTFDANGGTCNTASKTVTYNSTYGTLPTPTRAGYEFLGWGVKDLINVEDFTDSSKWCGTGYSKLPLQLRPNTTYNFSVSSNTIYQSALGSFYILITDNIDYNGSNGGHGVWIGHYSSQSLCAENVSFTTKADSTYYFAVGGGASKSLITEVLKDIDLRQTDNYITNSSTVTNSCDHALYAIWDEIPYTLDVYPNGGTYNSSTSNVTITQDFGTDYQLAVPTRTGYTFKGWVLINNMGLSSYGVPVRTNVDFASGKTTGVGVYNNKGGGTVVHTIKSGSPLPTSSYYLNITTSGVASPGAGGFGQSTYSVANGVFYHVILARIPVGYNISTASNGIGTGGKYGFITSTAGTGDWQVYVARFVCGTEGNFSTFGHTYISGPDNTNVSWDIAYANVFDASTHTTGWTDPANLTIGALTYKIPAGNNKAIALWDANEYTVTFDANGGTCDTESKTVTYDSTYGTLPTSTRTGYNFLGWYTATTSGTKVESGTKVTKVSNHTLYAMWEIKPSITTENASAVYGSTDAMSVNVANASGYSSVTYQWYTVATAGAVTGGTAISGATSSTYTSTETNVGTYNYYCVITITGTKCNPISATVTKAVTTTITKSSVTIPTGYVKEHTYTGSSIAHGYTAPVGTTIVASGTTASAVNAGTYNIVLAVDANHVWSDGTTTSKTVTWRIKQATNSWTTTLSMAGFTYGENATSPVAAAKFGTVVFTYKAQGASEFTSTKPVTAGTHTVKAVVAATGNYTGLEATTTYTVSGASVTIPTGYVKEYTYTGNSIAHGYTAPVGTTIVASGTTASAVNAGTYNIVLAVDANHVWSDGTTTSKTVTWRIKQATNSWTTTLSMAGFTYGENATSPVAAAKFGTVVFTYKAQGASEFTSTKPVTAGTHTVKAVVVATGNYTGLETTTTYTVSKRAITITAASASKVYDGTALTKNEASLTSGTIVSGQTATYSASGTITNVGTTNNVPSVVIKSGSTDVTSNYNVTKVNGTLTITKAEITYTAENVSVVYDGAAHGLVVNVTKPSGATIKYGTSQGTYNLTTSPTVTSVGEITVYFEITADNYTAKTGSATVKVTARPITITAASASKVYDGTALTKNSASLTSGTIVSGQTATYSASGTITNVGSANNVPSVVIKSGSTDVTSNYAVTKVNGTLTITKADNTVKVTANTITYNGSAQALVSVSGNKGTMHYNVGAQATTSSSSTIPTRTNAGAYVVYWLCEGNSNYKELSGNVTVTIKAKNISGVSITNVNETYTYTASAITPIPTVTDTVLSDVLVKDTDYTVSYTNNTNVGTATITITGKGNYTGTATKTFTIAGLGVTIVSSGNGTVSPQNIANVPTGAVITVKDNTLVINGTTVTATPNAGYVFNNWTGLPANNTVTGAVTITANFIKLHTVTLSITGIESGEVVTLSLGGEKVYTTNVTNEKIYVVNNTSMSFNMSIGEDRMLNILKDGAYTRSWYENGTYNLNNITSDKSIEFRFVDTVTVNVNINNNTELNSDVTITTQGNNGIGQTEKGDYVIDTNQTPIINISNNVQTQGTIWGFVAKTEEGTIFVPADDEEGSIVYIGTSEDDKKQYEIKDTTITNIQVVVAQPATVTITAKGEGETTITSAEGYSKSITSIGSYPLYEGNWTVSGASVTIGGKTYTNGDVITIKLDAKGNPIVSAASV